jgi:hypothetical protein
MQPRIAPAIRDAVSVAVVLMDQDKMLKSYLMENIRWFCI